MRLGVIGPRDVNGVLFNDQDYINDKLKEFEGRVKQVVSGGGRGVEKTIEVWAKERDLPFDIVLPNIHVHGTPHAFFVRNQTIITKVDTLIMFWDGRQQTSLPSLASFAMQKHVNFVVMPIGRSDG